MELMMGKEYVIRTDDVCDIFGLPKGEEKVTLIKKVRKKKSEDEHYMIKIKSLLNVSENDPLTTPMLAELIVNLKDGGHDFKRLFVLYVCSVFLAPTANWHVDLFLAKEVADVDGIINLKLVLLCFRCIMFKYSKVA
ncbi:Sensory neuron membrane protein 2 [Bienertia sinuspersici]